MPPSLKLYVVPKQMTDHIMIPIVASRRSADVAGTPVGDGGRALPLAPSLRGSSRALRPRAAPQNSIDGHCRFDDKYCLLV